MAPCGFTIRPTSTDGGTVASTPRSFRPSPRRWPWARRTASGPFPRAALSPVVARPGNPDARGTLNGRTVIAALEDRDGSLWLGTLSGLLLCRGEAVTAVDFAPGTPQAVMTFFEDSSGTLWLGTLGDGLWCLRDPLLTSFGTPEGLKFGYVNTVLEAGEGAVWIGTQSNGLVRWCGREVRSFTERERPPHREVAALLEDSKGTLWVGTPGGLARFDGKGRLLPVPLPTKGAPVVFSLAELGDGSVLAGTTAGIPHDARGALDRHRPRGRPGFRPCHRGRRRRWGLVRHPGAGIASLGREIREGLRTRRWTALQRSADPARRCQGPPLDRHYEQGPRGLRREEIPRPRPGRGASRGAHLPDPRGLGEPVAERQGGHHVSPDLRLRCLARR